MRNPCSIALAAGFLASTAGADMFVPIDLSGVSNTRSTLRNAAYPTGSVQLGGVPFVIPTDGNNEWRHAIAGYGSTITLDVPVGVFGVDRAYTLINSDWGMRSGGWMQVEFFGSDGAYYARDLVGDSDLRDWNGWWTNRINNVTTVNVMTIPLGHDGDPDFMDMQIYDLPPEFLHQTLMTMRITDLGILDTHCGILSGLTVPEPATLVLLTMGLLTLLRGRR